MPRRTMTGGAASDGGRSGARSQEGEKVTTLSDSLRASLSRLIAERLGLHFPPDRWSDLERGLRAAAREAGRSDLLAYAHDLLCCPPSEEEMDRLAAHLTVGETYFFRERPIFEALQEHILPPLIHLRRTTTRHLRLWSAGCASGEEPYSLAIVLTNLIPDITDWQITLLATDVNPRSLRKAADAIYGEWSFRGVPPALKHTYFQPVASGRWRLRPEIQRLVSWARLNLVEEVYPSPTTHTQAMDIILCCNVLMYFAPEQARRVVERLRRCLCEGGWLIVGPSEVSHTLFSSYTSVSFPGVIVYRAGDRLSVASGIAPAQESATRLPVQSELSVRDVSPPLGNDPGVEPATEKAVPLPPVMEPFESPSGEEPERSSAEPKAGLSSVTEARSLYRCGRVEEAREKLLESLGQHPTGEALRLLARMAADRGQLTEALDWCDRAIAQDKLVAESHYLRGLILQELGQTDEAIRSLRRVLYLDPRHALAHLALGYLVWRQGRRSDARKHLQLALSRLNDRPERRLSDVDSLTTGDARALIRSLLTGDTWQ